MEHGLHSTRIQELLAASDGTVWVATEGGVSRWQNHRLEMLDDPAVRTVRCRALAEDARSRMWIGSENGVAVFAKGNSPFFIPAAARSGPRVYDILSDRDGILVAADNGMWRFPWDGAPLAVSGPPGIDRGRFPRPGRDRRGAVAGNVQRWRLAAQRLGLGKRHRRHRRAPLRLPA